MLNKFKENMKSLLSADTDEKILLAVSGGIDSMVMLDLFIQNKCDIGIAHCNFKLRDGESDQDEIFIREKAAQEDIPFYINHFETEEYAKQNGISIQMAARDLRYEWFYQLLKKHGYHKIALAHNLDDKVETFFINLIRGTGLKGITGMKQQNDVIIRPLLNFTRNEIESYAGENYIEYREDSSNRTTKYLRNKIRHDVMPILKGSSNNFLKSMNENMSRFERSWQVYQDKIDDYKKEIINYGNDCLKIDIEGLKNNPFKEILAFEIFSEYNFTQTSINNILEALDHHSGLQFFSPTHRCIKDRSSLLITKTDTPQQNKYYIEEGILEIGIPIKLTFETFKNEENYILKKDSQIAQLDADKIDFPLILRRWQKGDYFHPIGMKGIKKLSDYFTDNKFSLLDKENAWILTSGEKIIWIVGHRMDDHFKITENTRSIMVVSLI